MVCVNLMIFESQLNQPLQSHPAVQVSVDEAHDYFPPKSGSCSHDIGHGSYCGAAWYQVSESLELVSEVSTNGDGLVHGPIRYQPTWGQTCRTISRFFAGPELEEFAVQALTRRGIGADMTGVNGLLTRVVRFQEDNMFWKHGTVSVCFGEYDVVAHCRF